MRVFDAVYPAPVTRLTDGTPFPLLVALAAVAGGAQVVPLPPRAAAAVVVSAIHGALLVTAIGWAAHERGWDPRPLQALVLVAIGLAGAALFIGPGAAVLYLPIAGVLGVAACRGALRPLGVRPPGAAALALGVALGAVLSGHLLWTASRMLGLQARHDAGAIYLAALAYDVTVNVPSAELFFRGALLDRLQRRTSLVAAGGISAAACTVRYLADPLLPRTPEVVAGTAFYVLALSSTNAWLRYRTGSVWPGVGGALVFFAAWRLLESR